MLDERDLRAVREIAEEVTTNVVVRFMPDIVAKVTTRIIDERVPEIIDERVPKIIDERVPKIIDRLVPGMIKKSVHDSEVMRPGGGPDSGLRRSVPPGEQPRPAAQ